jgi:hypothetical protein
MTLVRPMRPLLASWRSYMLYSQGYIALGRGRIIDMPVREGVRSLNPG